MNFLKANTILWIATLLVMGTTLHAQQAKLSEANLLELISTTDSLEVKQKLYNTLHLKFRSSDQEKSLHYGLKRLEVAEKIEDKKYRISAKNTLGWYLINSIEQPDSAKPYLESALEEALEINDSAKIANNLTYTGFMYQMKSFNETAMEYYFQSIAYKEKLDDKRGLAFSYNLIGKVYEFQNQYSKSLTYHFKALDLRQKYVDSLQVAHSLKNIGWTYFKDGQYERSIDAFHHCARLAKRHKRRLSFAYNGLGSNYLALEEADSARYYFKKGLDLSKQIDIDFNTSQALVGLGNAHLLKGNLADARLAAAEAIKVTEEHRYYEQLKDANELLYKIEERKGNPSKALQYYKKFRAINDSIVSAESKSQIAEMEMRFNMEKKERELSRLKYQNDENTNKLLEEKSRRKRSLIFIAVLGSLLLIVGIFLRKNLLQKRELLKTVSEKNTLLKEVHHRVKNSFQIVSGLLFLQASNIKNREVEKALSEAQNRINSMVLLHQKLYKEGDLNGVNAQEYLEALVIDIISVNGVVQQIEKRISIASLILDIETISSIGLIVNELVTNAIKHAFTNTINHPFVKVTLLQKAEILELEVIDNGIGILNQKNDGMGLSLIEDLSKKLNAKVSFEEVQDIPPFGTKVTIDIQRYKVL